jgi:hypothetical protein
MRLGKLLEMVAYATQSPHPEYSEDEVNGARGWLLDGGHHYEIEGGKFFVVQKETCIGLFRSGDTNVIGWLTLKLGVEVFGVSVYPLGNIQILPKYRNTVAVLMLINAARSLLDRPVYVDDPVFQGGERLLWALAKRPGLPNITVIDKDTGERTAYVSGSLESGANIGLLLECDRSLIEWCDKYPGGERIISLVLFQDFHEELMKKD